MSQGTNGHKIHAFMSMGTAKQFLGLRERLEIEYIQVNTRFGDF